MRIARLLPLNSGASDQFRAALRDILCALPRPSLTSQHEVVEHNGDVSPEGLARLMSELNPNICFVTVKFGPGRPACELLEAVKACASVRRARPVRFRPG